MYSKIVIMHIIHEKNIVNNKKTKTKFLAKTVNTHV